MDADHRVYAHEDSAWIKACRDETFCHTWDILAYPCAAFSCVKESDVLGLVQSGRGRGVRMFHMFPQKA